MKNGTLSLVSYCVALLALLIVYLVITGRRLPFIRSDRAAFYVLWAIGLSMSILAGTRDMVDGKFIMPQLVLNILMPLGAISFLLPVIMLVGRSLPLFSNYRTAFFLLAGMIGVKWLLVQGTLLLRFLAGGGGVSA